MRDERAHGMFFLVDFLAVKRIWYLVRVDYIARWNECWTINGSKHLDLNIIQANFSIPILYE